MALLGDLFQNPALFFDRIGILVFLFILIDAAYDLKLKRSSRWRAWIRFVIGLLGLIVDGTLVMFYS